MDDTPLIILSDTTINTVSKLEATLNMFIENKSKNISNHLETLTTYLRTRRQFSMRTLLYIYEDNEVATKLIHRSLTLLLPCFRYHVHIVLIKICFVAASFQIQWFRSNTSTRHSSWQAVCQKGSSTGDRLANIMTHTTFSENNMYISCAVVIYVDFQLE